MSLEGVEETYMDDDEEFPNTMNTADIKKNLLDNLATPSKAKSDLNGDCQPGQEHMKVYLRVRPLSAEEKKLGEGQDIMQVLNDHTLTTNAPKDSHAFKNSTHGLTKQHHKFTFSRIFNEDTSQKDFFDDTMLTTVKEFVDGQNCLVFTYGVTNSGKTYTIQGHSKDGGVLPRALDVIFNSIEDRQLTEPVHKPRMFCDVQTLSDADRDNEKLAKDKVLKLASADEPDVSTLLGDTTQSTVNSTMSEDSIMQRQSLASTQSLPDNTTLEGIEDIICEAEERVRDEASIDVESQGQIKFSIWVTFAEVYNEYVYDLLVPLPKKKNARRPALQFREDKNGNPYCKGITEINVANADEAYKILTVGKRNLQIACTKLNHNSSRSHCIFTIKMLRVVDKDKPRYARMSMLSFCDLAGSERYTKTQSNGERIKEAGNINTSLLTLGRCMTTLRHNQLNKENQRIVPFRESKLTRLFQSFFCGKGRASMIVNVNQCASMFDETLHALKYSAIAKQVVVTQVEPEKPKEKKNRYVSMLLSQSPSRATRQTIGWATPGTYAKVMDEEEHAANLPLPEEDEDEDLEDASVWDGKEQELMVVVDHLKRELMEERRKLLQLEGQIRNEVCQEMAEQLVQIENTYTERLKLEAALAEEKADKRIELYSQSVKKTKKRKRIWEEEDDEEMVSRVLLHAQEVKTQDLEKEKEELFTRMKSVEEDLQDMKNAVAKTCKDRDIAVQKCTESELQIAVLGKKVSELSSLEGENSELKIQMEDIEKKLQEKDQNIESLLRDLESYKDMSTREEQTSQIGDLISKLADAEQEAEAAHEQTTKFQQVIDMLQCDISEKEAKIEEYKSMCEQVKNGGETSKEPGDTKSEELLGQLDNYKKQLNELNEKLMESEDGFKAQAAEFAAEMTTEYQNKLKDINEKFAATEDSYKLKNEELKAKLFSSEEELKAKLEELSKVDNINKEGTSNAEIQAELDEMSGNVEEKDTTLAEKNKVIDQLSIELEEVKKCLAEKQQSLEEMKINTSVQNAEQAEMSSENVQKLENTVAELKSELLQSQTRNVEFEKLAVEEAAVFKTAQEELSSVHLNLTALHEELNQHKKESEEAISEKNKILASSEEKKQQLEDLLKQTEEKTKELEEQLAIQNSSVTASEKTSLHTAQLQKEVDNLKNLMKEKNSQLTTLENSLKSANEFVRKKVLAIGDLEKKNKELEMSLATANKAVTSLTMRHEKLQTELNDYILRVNEQAEQIGDLHEKAETKAKENEILKQTLNTQSDDSNTMEELKNNEKQLITIKEELEQLKQKLATEQEQNQSAKNDMEELLQSKVTLIGQLEAQISENEIERVKLQKELEKSNALEKEQREKALSDLKDNEENEKLKVELETLRADNQKLAESKVQSETNVEELNEKISALKRSLDVAEEEYLSEVEELKSELAANTQELNKKEIQIKALEEDILRYQKDIEGTKSDEQAETESLRSKVRDLEQQVIDVEYKHQMSCKQIRREKSQLEKLLKETEEAAAASEEKTAELEQQISGLKDNHQELSEQKTKEMSDTKQKLSNVEDAMRDLEKCLQLSKDGEAKLRETVESYKLKNRHLEEEIAAKEEQIQTLQEDMKKEQKTALECSESDMAELRKQMREKENSLETLKEELEVMRESKQKMEHELQMNSIAIETTKEEVLELMEKLDAKNKEINIVTKQFNDANDLVMEKDKLAADKESMLGEIKCKSEKLTAEVSSMSDKIVSLEKELETAKECQGHLVKDLEQSKSELLEKLTSSEQVHDKLQTEYEELQTTSQEAASELSRHIDELATATTECSELREKVTQLEADLSDTNKLKNTVRELQETVTEVDKLKQQVSSLETEKHKALKRVLELEDSEQDAKRMKIEVEKLQTSSDEAKTLREELSSLKSRAQAVEKLEHELESLRTKFNEMEKEKNKVEDELQSRESSLKSSQKQINVLKEAIASLETQVDKCRERETTLRTQLKETSKQQEEQNKKFTLLENKLRNVEMERDNNETSEKVATDNMNKIKNEISDLNDKIREQKDEIATLKRTQRSDERKLDELTADKDSKEKELMSKSQRINDLMKNMEVERNSFKLAIKDHSSNEKMIEQMKITMEEQEKTMEAQDNVLQNREDEIRSLSKELDETLDKYKELLATKESSHSLVQRLEQSKDEAERQKLHLSQQLTETKRSLAVAEQSRIRLEADIQETNKELTHLDKQLHEKTRHIESLSNELESNRKEVNESRILVKESTHRENQAQLLRTKFQALENAKKQLEQELDQIKGNMSTLEQRKDQELQKWREERDKLVTGLETILKQKDAELKVMKQTSSGKNSGEMASAVATLREQLDEKDNLIEELSRALDEPRPRPSRRTRHKSAAGSSDEDVEQLKKEITNLQNQLEQEKYLRVTEITKIVKAKDEIIGDMKEQNVKLTSCLSNDGNMQINNLDSTSQSQADHETSTSSHPTKTKRSTRTRPKKRKSIEVDNSEHAEYSETVGYGKKRQSTRSSRRVPKLKLDENEDPSMDIIQEEDTIDLDESVIRKGNISRILSNSTNTETSDISHVTSTPHCDRIPKFVSPLASPTAPPAPARKGQRKKRGLTTPSTELLMDTPSAQASEVGIAPSSPHMIVGRKLRNRRR